MAYRGQALPALRGSYYTVRPGETLWGISQSFGVDVPTLAAANRLPNPGQLEVGQRLFIPLPAESTRFLWPLRGTVQQSGASLAIDIAAADGSLVRASRRGQVGVAAQYLAGWGKTIILVHDDGFATVYAGMDQVLVNPGSVVFQGMPVGRVGSQPLHFEIRYGTALRNPLVLLSAPP